ncbi:unnamed protein product [Sympodiomycopsis kandeliae]
MQVSTPTGAVGLFFVGLGARRGTYTWLNPDDRQGLLGPSSPGCWGVAAAHHQLCFKVSPMPSNHKPKGNDCKAYLVFAMRPEASCLDTTQIALQQIPRPFDLLLEGVWEVPDTNPSTANARMDHFRQAIFAAFGAQDVIQLAVMVTVEGTPSYTLPPQDISSEVFPVDEDLLQSEALLPPLAGVSCIPFYSPQIQSGYVWSSQDGDPYSDSKSCTVYLYNAVVVTATRHKQRKET